jgi:hypothetical protein
MESIAHTSRRAYAEAPGGNTNRISGEQPQRLASRATKIKTNTSCCTIFHRTLLWIKGWVQSRVKAASLNRALSPFISAAKSGNSSVITPEQLKKLEAALADGARPHAVSLLAETVRASVKSLNLVELKRLQLSLGQLTPSGTRFQKDLSATLDRSIEDAKINEAKCHLLETLSIFSKMSAAPVDPDFLVSDIQHHLLRITNLAQPMDGISARSGPRAARKISFESASSIITRQALKTWFDEHSAEQQASIKADLWRLTNDYGPARNGAEADQAVFAFCRTVTTVLWPEDSRHASWHG